MAFAHSANPSGVRHDLVDHLRAVAETAGHFGLGLEAGELAYYAGLWHDIGKFHPDFQSYLLRSEESPKLRGHGPDHKAAGCSLSFEHLQPLALLIQGHHGGLREINNLEGWLEEKGRSPAVGQSLALARAAIPDLEPDGRLTVPEFARKDRAATELFLRLVFSALVDADFLDTERHFRDDKAAARGIDVRPTDLWQRFEDHHSALTHESSGDVNQIRDSVYNHCLAAAGRETGFFKLAVPTGGGKTLSAMAFALRHAAKHGLDRVIVAVPFISITEQTAKVYRDVFGDSDGVVLEHHSLAKPDDDDAGDFHADAVWDRLAAENWDAPVIVTTTVQLFESLFSNKTSRTRKLHRLARSVIILDEAQALPPHLLKPILDGLQQLVAHYGTTVVISTATQPAFETIPEFAAVPGVEIVPEPAPLFEALRRVEYEWRTETPAPWAEAASWMREQPQALAIVNTKKDALALLDALDDPQALHLSTLLCGAHRRDVIDEIKRRLTAGEPCRLVSTQVIEAGVDLDFPFVLRALAPLDSMIQAASRCNREGILDRGRVVIFKPESGGLPQGAYRAGTDITAALIDGGNIDPNTPDAARAYFRRLFTALDTDSLRIQPTRRSLNYPETARNFKMIDDDTYSVVVTAYGSDSERQRISNTLDELSSGSPQARGLHRRLQPYVVAVRKREAGRLLNSGLIQAIRPGYGIWLGGYDPIRGFTGADPDVLMV